MAFEYSMRYNCPNKTGSVTSYTVKVTASKATIIRFEARSLDGKHGAFWPLYIYMCELTNYIQKMTSLVCPIAPRFFGATSA